MIDRAKRLLESSDLASLRRAVEVDIDSSTVVWNTGCFGPHKEAVGGRHHPLQIPGARSSRMSDGGAEDSWDDLTMAPTTEEQISRHVLIGNAIGLPRAGSEMKIPLRKHQNKRGERGGVRATVPKHVPMSLAKRAGGIGASEWSSTAQERPVVSLTHLSISSKTVAFPPGHVPCFMGTKGHGKKRGRINHFAVRTPPSTPGGEEDTGIAEGLYGLGCNDGSDSGPRGTHHQIAKGSGWNLPHELDPTSALISRMNDGGGRRTTAQGGGNRRRGMSRFTQGNSRDFSTGALGSRPPSSAATNSSGRLSAIMLGAFTGVAKDHAFHPPPPAATSCSHQFCGRSREKHPLGHDSGAPGHTSGGRRFGGVSCDDKSGVSSPLQSGLRHHHQPPTVPDVLDHLVHGDSAGILPYRTLESGNGGGDIGNDSAVPLSTLRPYHRTELRDAAFPAVGSGMKAIESSSSVGGWNEDDRTISSASAVGDILVGVSPRIQTVGDRNEAGVAAAGDEGLKRQDSPVLWSVSSPTLRTETTPGDAGGARSRGKSAVRGWTPDGGL